MNPLLSVKDLHVYFQSKNVTGHAVRGLHFSLNSGETLGIIGESGCGKSAAVKALVKLFPANATVEGEVQYGGKNVLVCSESELQAIRKKEIAIIFQDPMKALNPTQRIGIQLIEAYRQSFPAVFYEEAYVEALDILEKVKLPSRYHLMQAYPHTLSGGMKQRLLIAIALIRQPKVLIADEPTTALDAINQFHMLELFKQYQQTVKMSVILISHDLRLMAQFCDRILVMYAGKIVESAPVKELFCNARHPYTQQLIQSLLPLKQTKNRLLNTIEGHPPHLSLPLKHCGFCERCPQAMNICATAIPALYPVGPSHWSACFKHDPRCPL